MFDFERYKSLSGWDDIPIEYRNSAFEQTVTGSKFGGILLPARLEGQSLWYAIAFSARAWRSIQPLLVSYVGHTVTTFTGEPSDLSDDVEVEHYLKSLEPYAVARLEVRNRPNFANRALFLMLGALETKPEDLRPPPLSTAQIIANFDMCLLQGDRDGAAHYLDRLRSESRIDPSNVQFSSVRFYAAFREWSQITGNPTFRELCQVTKPVVVATDLLEAVWAQLTMRSPDGISPDRDIYFEKYRTFVDSIFASTPTLRGEVVDRFSVLEPSGLGSQSNAAGADLGLDQTVVQTAAQIDDVADWDDWLSRLDSVSFDDFKSKAEEIITSHPAVSYVDPSGIEKLANRMVESRTPLGSERFACALPVLIKWSREDPEHPRREMRPIYEALLLELLTLSTNKVAYREASLELIAALLEVGVSDYPAFMRDISEIVPSGAGDADVLWLLDLVDVLCRNTAASAPERTELLNTILSSLSPRSRGFGQIERQAYIRVADFADWPSIDAQSQEIDSESLDDLRDKTIGIYTLSKRAGAIAAKALSEAAPGVRVQVSSDHVCTSRLKSLAQNADLMVLTTSAATHAGIDCVLQNRKVGEVLYAAGKGYCSILRAVVDYAEFATDFSVATDVSKSSAERPTVDQNAILTTDLIDSDEDVNLEFKETYRFNTRTQKNDPELVFAVVREICGFLNSEGGVLLIGISDSGKVTGIGRDGYSGNDDKFKLMVMGKIRECLGTLAAQLVSARLERIEGQHVCRLDCKKSVEDVFCNFRGKDEALFVRVGSATHALSPSEVVRRQSGRPATS
jgi:hypothetical protein